MAFNRFLGSDKIENQQILIITDDLSSMGAIKKYMRKTGDNFSAIAIKAFEAGHDMLLFSHFSQIDKRSSFSLKDLEDTRYNLIKFIKARKERDSQFRSSLCKILALKAKVAKFKHLPIEKLLNNKNGESPFYIPYNGKRAKEKCKDGLKFSVDKIELPEDLVRETIRHACTLINRNASYDLRADHSESNVVFYIYEEGLAQYRTNITPLLRNPAFRKIPAIKNGNAFKSMCKTMRSDIKKADLIVYTVFDKSDVDLILRENKVKSFANKTVLLCHNSPLILDNDMLTDFTVISTFTNHPYSYDIDVEVLLNHYKPNGMTNLPISIGANGKIYNVTHTTFIEPNNALSFEKVMPRYSMDEKTVTEIRFNNYLIPKHFINDVLMKIVFIFINVVAMFICIGTLMMGFIKKYDKVLATDKQHAQLNDVKDNGSVHNYSFGLTILFTLIIDLFIFLPQTTLVVEWIKEVLT